MSILIDNNASCLNSIMFSIRNAHIGKIAIIEVVPTLVNSTVGDRYFKISSKPIKSNILIGSAY